MVRILATTALALLATGAHALNKCTDGQGKVSYSDRPCEGGVQARVSISDNTATMLTPQERAVKRGKALQQQTSRRTASVASVKGPGPEGSSSGTGESVKVGDTRSEVTRKLGSPKREDATYFDRNCNRQQEVLQYAPRSRGDLTQTIFLCDGKVVEIKHDPFVSTTASDGSGEPAQLGDTRTVVESKLGRPKSKQMVFSDPSCNGRRDVYQYPPRNRGDLAATIYFCDNRVVDVKYDR